MTKPNKPNIVLITIDCLRADHLKYMPRLMKRSPLAIYTNFFSNGTFTPLSIPCMLSSVYPPLSEPQTTIVQLLKEIGYNTAGFVPNAILLEPRYRKLRLENGFDFYETYLMENSQSNFKRAVSKLFTGIKNMIRLLLDYDSRFFEIIDIFKVLPAPLDLWLPYPQAEKVLTDAKKRINKMGHPYFLWVHIMDSHSPYFPPDFYRSVDKKIMKALNLKLRYCKHWRSLEDVKLIHKLYVDELKYIDDSLSKFIDGVMDDNTYFVITSDHGEQFMEHGGMEHISWCMNDEQIKIPFVILNYRNTRKNFLASLINVAPALADLAGINHEFVGQSFLKNDYEEKPIFIVGLNNKKIPLYGIRTKNWKLFEGIII